MPIGEYRYAYNHPHTLIDTLNRTYTSYNPQLYKPLLSVQIVAALIFTSYF